MLRLKSVNELPQEEDGFRILIDEFWPDGLSPEEGKVDLWLKEIRPPTDFDEWREEDSGYFENVQGETPDEIMRKKNLIKFIRATEEEKGTVTFLYSRIKSIAEFQV